MKKTLSSRSRRGAKLVLCALLPLAGGVLPAIATAASPIPARPADSASRLLAPESLECDAGSAYPLIVADPAPHLSWWLVASSARLRDVQQSAYRIVAADSRQAIERNDGDLWDSGVVHSRATLGIVYAGKTPAPETQVFWKVMAWDAEGAPSAWSRVATWTAAPAAADWKARWIEAPNAGEREGADEPMPIFRREFTLAKPVRRALLLIAGLGQDEVYVNGRAANARTLAPGWSQYNKTVFYDAYDVTGLLRPGANAVGVMLGNGMYNVQKTPGRYTKFVGSFGPPKLIAEIRLEYDDGSVSVIGTDSSWKSAPGPITFSSTYGGEDYDARREQDGWAAPGFRDADWKKAALTEGPGGKLTPEIAPPVEKVRVYRPVQRTVLHSGVVIYDLSQNFAGWPEVRVRGQAGAWVEIRASELLNPDGSLNLRNRWRAVWFTYTLRGSSSPEGEDWSPRFSYYGFRYVQVQTFPAPGATRRPVVLSLVGDAVHSSRAVTGEWSSSNRMLNRIHALIVHAMENNTVSILTDCPQREKLGWLEQTQLMASPLLYDADLRRVYAAMERDMEDVQRPNGLVPTTAPQDVVFGKPWNVFDDSPEWGSAATLDPWMVYQRTGALAPLAAHYGMMRRYAAYLASRAQDGIVAYGLGDWYDIGPGAPGFSKLTTLGVTGTATYYQDLDALAGAARALGKPADERRYRAEADAVRAAFNAKYFHPSTNQYDRGSQTANAMPLALGMVPLGHRAAVLANLIAGIRAHHNHTTCGEVGWRYEVEALMDAGRGDVLRDMMLRTDPPSYGAQLAAGATALTEAWNASPANSQDHFMLGYGEEWFYAGLAGLHVRFGDASRPVIVISPELTPGIDWVKTSYDSVLGRILIDWRREGARVLLNVTIPANASARIELPAPPAASVSESGREAKSAPGVMSERQQGAVRLFEVASGAYRFVIESQPASRTAAP